MKFPGSFCSQRLEKVNEACTVFHTLLPVFDILSMAKLRFGILPWTREYRARPESTNESQLAVMVLCLRANELVLGWDYFE